MKKNSLEAIAIDSNKESTMKALSGIIAVN